MRIILLDTGPLGLLVLRRGVSDADACRSWLERVVSAGNRVIVPEIADYELRRELLRLGHSYAVSRLDRYETALEYLQITTETMRYAASLWAEARRTGLPTADPKALDGDMILAAQALLLREHNTVVATSNPVHLKRFVPAEEWQTIE